MSSWYFLSPSLFALLGLVVQPFDPIFEGQKPITSQSQHSRTKTLGARFASKTFKKTHCVFVYPASGVAGIES